MGDANEARADGSAGEQSYKEQAKRVLGSVNACSIVAEADQEDLLATCRNCGEEAHFKLLNLCLNCHGER